jgi:hypothetical protein
MALKGRKPKPRAREMPHADELMYAWAVAAVGWDEIVKITGDAAARQRARDCWRRAKLWRKRRGRDVFTRDGTRKRATPK